jgi:large subunit ribosomal protein L37Ae
MANASIRYGARIRKRARETKAKKIALYKCDSCGKIGVERIGTSIWRCRHCNATYAGGAYTLTTTAGELAGRLISGISVKSEKMNK